MVKALRQVMERQNTTLAKAYKLHRQNTLPTIGGGGLNWLAITNAFLDDLRSKGFKDATIRLYKRPCDGLMELIESDEPPTTGPELQQQYFNAYLKHLSSGSWGRKRNIDLLGIILRYAVEKGGAPEQWLPITAKERQELAGPADSDDATDRPPIKPEQLSKLLDAIEQAGHHELYLAVGLVGLFGLRPCELATMEYREGNLYVGKVKRNSADMKRSGLDQKRKGKRLALAIDVPGKEGLGEQLAESWGTGRRKLPASIQTLIDKHKDGRDVLQRVGNTFAALLS